MQFGWCMYVRATLYSMCPNVPAASLWFMVRHRWWLVGVTACIIMIDSWSRASVTLAPISSCLHLRPSLSGGSDFSMESSPSWIVVGWRRKMYTQVRGWRYMYVCSLCASACDGSGDNDVGNVSPLLRLPHWIWWWLRRIVFSIVSFVVVDSINYIALWSKNMMRMKEIPVTVQDTYIQEGLRNYSNVCLPIFTYVW